MSKHVENDAADRAAAAKRRRRDIRACDELLRRLVAHHAGRKLEGVAQ
jgi:hypothetical protein